MLSGARTWYRTAPSSLAQRGDSHSGRGKNPSTHLRRYKVKDTSPSRMLYELRGLPAFDAHQRQDAKAPRHGRPAHVSPYRQAWRGDPHTRIRGEPRQ